MKVYNVQIKWQQAFYVYFSDSDVQQAAAVPQTTRERKSSLESQHVGAEFADFLRTLPDKKAAHDTAKNVCVLFSLLCKFDLK